MGQDYSTFKTIFDTLSLPYQKSIDKEIARQSKVLSFLFKATESDKAGKPVSGIPTFEGRYVKMAINAEYPVTQSNINQFLIQHGDVKQPKKGKNLVYAEIDAVDKAFTMGIYTSDLQQLKTKGADRNSQIYMNWINDYLASYTKGFCIHLTNSIYNGLGSAAVDDQGNSKPDFFGLITPSTGIIGTGSYGGKASTDFYEWRGHIFNLMSTTASARAGYTASDVNTVSQLVSVATGRKTSRFYDIINKIRLQMEEIAGEEIICVMPPAVYDYCWIPSLESNQINTTSRLSLNGNALEVKDDITKLGSMTVFRENTRIPTSETGGTPQYVLPSNTILFLNTKYLHLEVESMNNFVTSDWEEIPNQYNTLQKSMTSTLLFYSNKRWAQSVLYLTDNVKSELDGTYNY